MMISFQRDDCVKLFENKVCEARQKTKRCLQSRIITLLVLWDNISTSKIHFKYESFMNSSNMATIIKLDYHFWYTIDVFYFDKEIMSRIGWKIH